ncbi:MAG: GNAT family N-acetyltransferase [Bacillota bacterium]
MEASTRTEELTLRSFSLGDHQYWQDWEQREDLYRYMNHTKPMSWDEQRNYPADNCLLWMIEINGQPVGAVWLEEIDKQHSRAKLGILLEAGSREKGLGTEVVLRVCNYALYQVKLGLVYLFVRETNQRAIRCFQKAGFYIDEVLAPRRFADGSYQHLVKMVRNM